MTGFQKYLRVALPALLLAMMLSGCPGREEPCEPGTHEEGARCVPDTLPAENPCEPNPCTQPHRGQCTAVDGAAVCACDPGTREVEGGRCVEVNACDPNPCTTPHKTDCTVADGRAVCACVPGYVPEGDGCAPEEPPVTCAGQHSTGDSFEPDECPALAHTYSLDGPRYYESHSLSPASDEDWFRFSATAGRIYELGIGASPDVRLDVDVYATDATTVLTSNHTGTLAVNPSFKASASGDVFVRVRAHADTSGGDYTFIVFDKGEDDHADDPAHAAPVTLSGETTVRGLLQFDDDRDVIRFTAGASRSYRFTALHLTTTPPGTLLFDLIAPDGSTVLASAVGESAEILTRLVTAGDYFLRVRKPPRTTIASYLFRLDDLGPDDHGDSLAEATPISSDAVPGSGHFDRLGDVDVLSFQAQAGEIHAFTCTPAGYAERCLVTLLDADGHELARDHEGTTGYLAHEFARAGTYSFRLETFIGGNYTWKLEYLGRDDHGDTPATATALSIGVSSNGRLELAGDVDVFSFTAQAGHFYEFTCSPPSVTDCNVELVDGEGRVLASDTTSTLRATVGSRLASTGTYFLRVRGGPGSTGHYQYWLNDYGLDDHGDTPATATPLTEQVPGDGRIGHPGDLDVFAFSAEADHIYQLSCTPTTYDFACQAALLDGSGAVLVQGSPSTSPTTLRYELRTAGTYYLQIRAGNAYFGNYSYRLEDLGPDDHGDTQETATVVLPVTRETEFTSGRFELPEDVDYLSFKALAGHTYELLCTGCSGAVLLDASGTEVLRATRDSDSVSMLLTREMETEGTWYLRLEGPSESTYSWRLLDRGVDDHGDTPATATRLESPETVLEARLESLIDVDVFTFSAQAGFRYEFNCNPSSINCDLVLTNEEGTVLASDRANSSTAFLRYEPVSAGPLYLRVERGSGSRYGSTYTLTFREYGSDDHGDTRTRATLLVPSEDFATAGMQTPGDEDVFAFEAQAGYQYEFTCENPVSECLVSLENAAGTILVWDNEDTLPAQVSYSVRTAGTYYARVRQLEPTPSTYTYRLRNLGAAP